MSQYPLSRLEKRKALLIGISALAVTVVVALGVFARNGWLPHTDPLTGKKTGWFGRELPKNASSSWNPFAVPLPSPTPQLSKEYIYAGSRLLAVEDAGASPAGQRTNYALAANGSIAFASSTYGAMAAGGVINGDRAGLNWGTTGGWHDNTAGTYPDWVEVDFPASRTIDEVDVITIQDNFQSPAQPTEAMTFSTYGATSFEVQHWDGSAWQTIPGTSVTGNDKVWRKFTFGPITTTKIRVLVHGTADGYTRLVEVEAWGRGSIAPTPTPTPTPPGRVNVALAANGGVASASSTYGGMLPSGVVNGDRAGNNWGTTGGWHDNSSGDYPDWVQVDFDGAKTIDEIDVFTIQDSYQSPSEPNEAMTFSLHGITSFDVQYWDGSTWVTAPGGAVTGNNKVWRKFSFSPITTSKIRTLVNASVDGYSRIVEIEAWSGGSASPTPTPVPEDFQVGCVGTSAGIFVYWTTSPARPVGTDVVEIAEQSEPSVVIDSYYTDGGTNGGRSVSLWHAYGTPMIVRYMKNQTIQVASGTCTVGY